MPVRAACPSCSSRLDVPPHAAGLPYRCPRRGSVLVVRLRKPDPGDAAGGPTAEVPCLPPSGPFRRPGGTR